MPTTAGEIPFDFVTPDHVAVADEVIGFDDADPAYRLLIPVERPGRTPTDTFRVLKVVVDHDARELQEAFLRTMALAAAHAAHGRRA